jgi:L-alanine-DL-glutamate epimerase-like enolase superfamily enzyme
VKLVLHQFDLPLQHPFTISRETIEVQPTLIVELQDGNHRGFGEATANDYYNASIQQMIERLVANQTLIESHSASDPVGLYDALSQQLPDDPFPLCAVDQAAHDLFGKIQGCPLYKLWGLATDDNPVSNFTIGIDRIDVMVQKMEEAAGWPIYKIKLGTDQDLEIVRELRQHTDAPFRVDANCGWTAEEAIQNSRQLKALGVEFIEQPLPADDWQGQQRLFGESALPVIADESCIGVADVPRCDGYFHGVNIKLAKCGGLTPARRMIADARQRGMKVMVGCMTESTVGISAIAQLLPLLDFVDMDGAALLAEDIANGAQVVRGVCHYAQENGTGASLK